METLRISDGTVSGIPESEFDWAALAHELAEMGAIEHAYAAAQHLNEDFQERMWEVLNDIYEGQSVDPPDEYL